ncbi:probable LRR receptor-like serine/threonine-protein kinase At3g47570 [Cornus florida]|uniref:probable LRR receptor-like serine/threonine-protein kinase At3g47570 n=1 Tax=Cornus florida TaxID=4283 RepID=UPI00289964D8|nr:probable LRR receptor-like serine/threonine-protein kinase At3g47570 [Cornus florida]
MAIPCAKSGLNDILIPDSELIVARPQIAYWESPTLSYAELQQATNRFSLANLIGVGSYGFVYKGILNSGEQIVAVKVFNHQLLGFEKNFLAECEALRNICHRNLVKIITSCSSVDFIGNDFKALVFEFMPNGSLENWLHPISSDQLNQSSSMRLNSKNLNLIRRLNIAIDVASALDYLHHQCEMAIIHCDLKPSNVLLDSDLCAHVGDFGLARFLVATNGKSNYTQSSSSIGVRGTIGYIAPVLQQFKHYHSFQIAKYGMGGEVSTEGDVYSYGILLLEMFTGKRPTSSMFTDNFSPHNYAKMALPDGVMGIVDSLLILEEDDESERANQRNIARTKDCLVSVLRIGVICSSDIPRERLDITDVLNELHKIINAFLMYGREERKSEKEMEEVIPS